MLKITVLAVLTSLLLHYIQYDIPQDDERENLNELIIKGKFEKGTIFNGNDYSELEILRFNRRNRTNAFLFCVVRDSTNIARVIEPNEIVWYTIGNDHYKSHSSSDEFFFIKLSKDGKAKLYERSRIPNDNRFLYYIELEGYNDYLVISPHEKNITVDQIPGAYYEGKQETRMVIYSNQLEEKFKLFVTTYLGDCMRVKNSVESGFYTVNEVPAIIDVYNNCFED